MYIYRFSNCFNPEANGFTLVSVVFAERFVIFLFINTGHMSDPVDLPGLAHFCEHMLFLGTEKVRVTKNTTVHL